MKETGGEQHARVNIEVQTMRTKATHVGLHDNKHTCVCVCVCVCVHRRSYMYSPSQISNAVEARLLLQPLLHLLLLGQGGGVHPLWDTTPEVSIDALVGIIIVGY